jgi:hypothetical protein
LTYDYVCKKCDITETVERRINDAEVKPECPKCAEFMQRVYGSVAISFRGSGWGRG